MTLRTLVQNRLARGLVGTLVAAGVALPAMAATEIPVAIAEANVAETINLREKAEKKRIVVLDFFFADPNNRYWSSYGSGRAGAGISSKIINLLVNDGSVRVTDRSAVADNNRRWYWDGEDVGSAVAIGNALGVDYVLVGTVTEFTAETQRSGGGAFGIRVGSDKKIAKVALNARVIDTATSDVIAAADGEAEIEVQEGSGSFRGIGGSQSSSNSEGAMMNDAVDAAAEDLVNNLVGKL
ncbi:MAG: CsgG/HfaB family protein [Cyanobacteria bacterium P01_F01_bin.153]